jgi:hypothetical protein
MGWYHIQGDPTECHRLNERKVANLKNMEYRPRKHRSVDYDMDKYTPDDNTGLYVVRARQFRGKENYLNLP